MKNHKRNTIYIYCDGGCRGNQKDENIGGWGVLLMFNDAVKEAKGADINTSNNKMELKACIESLKLINDRSVPVIVTCDSKYVVDGITKWVNAWVKNNWHKKKPRELIKNKELWEELYNLKLEFIDIEFVHCKGHSDNAGNNRVDQLANEAMDDLD